MKNKRVLLVFAHPDDESFGPGGTIRLWADSGACIHLLCATKGEIGNNPTNGETARIRERELKEASAILGVEKTNFLGFKDGHIANRHIPTLERIITKKITVFKPHIILTFDLTGVSGHLDHVAVANAATSAFDKTQIAQKLYYYTLPRSYTDTVTEYFIHFPDGKLPDQIDETIDISSVWEHKEKAMRKHASQEEDIKRILESRKRYTRNSEHFLVRKRTSKK